MVSDIDSLSRNFIKATKKIGAESNKVSFTASTQDAIKSAIEELRVLLYRAEHIRLDFLNDTPKSLLEIREIFSTNMKTIVADLYTSMEYCDSLTINDSDCPE